jgi:Uma2 family endonuclease
MGMAHATLRWTTDMVQSLPDDGNRYELVDGALLVTPAPVPIHQRAVGLLARLLTEYVDQLRLGEVFESPADVQLEPETILQPDVFVVPEMAEPVRRWTDVRALLLAVEVLSPGSRRHDRITKRAFYARVGVPEYWVVDPDERRVERWRPGDERPDVLTERLTWTPGDAGEPFVLELPDLFARVHRERRGP